MSKIKAWFKHSMTILWARIVTLSGLLGAALINAVGDPNVTAAVQAAFSPKFIPIWLIGIGVVTEIVRSRTAGKPNA